MACLIRLVASMKVHAVVVVFLDAGSDGKHVVDQK
jgi:hypothetical protein